MAVILSIDCVDQPMMFYLKDGSLLQADSFKSRYRLMTKFFLITQINKAKNCLTLELLRPSSLCCNKDVLVPMDEFITIDINCLCGYQFISNTCIKECGRLPICIKNCICGPFTIPSGKDEMILWQSNLSIIQYGFINLCIEEGIENFVELEIYSSDPMEHKTYQITGQKSYDFFVTNGSVIKILRANIETKLQGTFCMNWNSIIH